MGKLHWIFLGINVVVAGWISLTSPGQAQVFNPSDTSGTNVFNNTAPQFGPGQGGLSPQTIQTANQISKELTDAQNAFAAAERAAAETTRRFATGTAEEPCVNPESVRLNQATEAAKKFLGTLNEEQIEQLQSNPTSRIW